MVCPRRKTDSGHVSLSEGDSVTEMDIVEDNEAFSGFVLVLTKSLSSKASTEKVFLINSSKRQHLLHLTK